MSNTEHDKPQSDHAVFTFGRFNPVTTGHKKLVDHVINVARHHGADHYIFASQSHDPKKNPLSYHQKVHFMQKMMPHANIEKTAHVKTALDAVKHLHKKGYKKVTMVVGGDRVQEFHNLLHKYNGKDYDIPHLKVQSAGHRDPDSEGVQGMSASKMRAHAAAGEFEKFKRGVPRQEHAKELYHAVRKGMKLEHIQRQNRAIFLVGAPGSGKDMILSAVLENTNLLELPLEKVFQAIANRQNLPEMVGNPSLIVNGTAESGQKVQITKQVLEAMGYATAMVYVHTTDAESRRRNEQRAVSGAKTISEDVRARKYNAAQIYMRSYSRSFDPFYLFDNSADLRTVNEEKKQEMLGWLVELGEGISRFLSGKDLNKLFENISATAVDNSVGATNSGASNSPTENDATIIQKGAPRRRINIKRPYSGTAMAVKNSSFGNAPTYGTVGESVMKQTKHNDVEAWKQHVVRSGGYVEKHGEDDYDALRYHPEYKKIGVVGRFKNGSGWINHVAESVQKGLSIWKYHKITGYWHHERNVTPETKDQWLKIHQDDEPNEHFHVSVNKPNHKPIHESVQDDVASSESPTSAQTKVAQKPAKTKGRRAAAPPPDFGDSRLGTVPSGGIGLVSNSFQPKGKTISELRRNLNSIRHNIDEE